MSILLVDDDDVAAEAVVRGLAKHAMRCPIAIAEDGRAALQVLRGTHPTSHIAKPYLVLLDLNMPRMNGFEFLRELRMDVELHATVVFVLTTSDSKVERAKAYQENIAGYMVKAAVGPQFARLAQLLQSYQMAVSLP